MKNFTITGLFRLMLLTGLFGMLGESFAQQAEMIGGGAGITVFRDRDFRGAAATYRTDMPNLDRTEFNDQISSIRVAPGEQWEVCEYANYRGRCVIITGEENDLRRNDWDNMISSMRRVRDGGGYPGPGPGPYPGEHPFIILHTDTNYRGNNSRYTDPQNNLFAMNNKAESVTVGRGEWQLCEGIMFGGRCVTVSQSVPNLNSLGMRDKIRSVRPVGYGGQNPGGGYVVIFDQINFRGTPTNYDSVETNMFKRARSITIGSGTWQICDGRNFTGRCETLSQSVANLGSFNINDTIRSLRPIGIVPPQPVPNPYIVIFENENFRGNPENYNSERPNINKRAGSITIGAGVWEVCSERNFRGHCETLSQSLANLRNTGLRDRIRSVRPLYRQPR
jgi:hypothetical protein